MPARAAACARCPRVPPSSPCARSSWPIFRRWRNGTKTAHRDSYVDVSKAQKLLGFKPRLSNEQALCETYDWYLANREGLGAAGVTHRVPWDQRALGLLKRLS